jgi:hypothetical protein
MVGDGNRVNFVCEGVVSEFGRVSHIAGCAPFSVSAAGKKNTAGRDRLPTQPFFKNQDTPCEGSQSCQRRTKITTGFTRGAGFKKNHPPNSVILSKIHFRKSVLTSGGFLRSMDEG